MKQALFHGSTRIVAAPSLAAARPHNDYGPGFYCAPDKSLAAEWACKTGKDGFVNTYELDDSELNILDLMSGEYTVLNWIALLMANRRFVAKNALASQTKELIIHQYSPTLEGVDVIIGYRADDSRFSYAEDFVENGLPVDSLNEALRLGGLGLQTVLVSEKAFDALTFQRAEAALASEHYGRFCYRDEQAREEYAATVRRMKNMEDAIFAMDIVRGKVEPDDARIPRMLRG